MTSAARSSNTAWKGAAPTISVLIPFLRDDPARLLEALDQQGASGVEVIIMDDGTGDTALTARLVKQIKDAALPACLITLSGNEGRAKGRNRLASAARGQWLLFLDSDMLPDSPRFLATYLELIADKHPAVAFGGFSLDQTPCTRAHALHRVMALKTDCMPVETRRVAPEKHVFTSNLLIRRDVFAAHGFDERFTGWGWEDVEWAMRVLRHHDIHHIDNTATHLGLDPAPVLAAKYEQSAANFARVVASHHAIVSTYPSYKAARILRAAPLRKQWRPVLKQLALCEVIPVRLRAFLMRLYRAALYAEAV